MKANNGSYLKVLHSHGCGGSIVLNEKFNNWSWYLEDNIDSCSGCGSPLWAWGEDDLIYKDCNVHADTFGNQEPLKTDNSLIIVHPFFVNLVHPSLINTHKRINEVDSYLNRISRVIEGRGFNRKKIDVVVFEDIYGYACATSLLMEEGLIDKVIFTDYGDGNGKKYETGVPKNLDELNQFADKNVFVGGMYNGRCLRGAINELEKIVKPNDNLKVVKDLVLNSPQYSEDLRPDKIYCGRYTQVHSSKLVGFREMSKIVSNKKEEHSKSFFDMAFENFRGLF